MPEWPLRLGVSYFGVRNPRHVREDLIAMRDGGCNSVLFTFSENDLQFYRETMAEIVGIAKMLGFETWVDPWGAGGTFGGEAFSQWVTRHDHARQILSDGRRAPAACLNHPDYRSFLTEWIDAVAELGADGVFWDEPHFFIAPWHGYPEGVWSCRCAVCSELFAKRFGRPLPVMQDRTVMAFQRESVRDMLRYLLRHSKEKGLRNAVCLIPDEAELSTGGAEWAEIAALEDLDVFGTDPYWLAWGQPVTIVGEYARLVARLAERHGKEPQVWILNFKIPAGRESEVVEATHLAYRAGVRNIMAWSYWGTGYMSSIRSENPERVWQEQTQAFRRLCETHGSQAASDGRLSAGA